MNSVKCTILVISMFWVCILWPGAFSQASQNPPRNDQQPTAFATPSKDQKAYEEANAIRDPDAKIAALGKWLEGYPDSRMKIAASRALFEALVKSHPEQQQRILDFATKATASAPDVVSGQMLSDYGFILFDAGILLNDAASFLAKGIAMTELQLQKRNAPFQAALGRIYVRQGKLDDAERLLSQALKSNPQLETGSFGMSELRAKREGKPMPEEEHRATVGDRVYPLPPDRVTQPEPIYRLPPPYTDEARTAKIEGVIVLQAVIRKDGSVTNIEIIKGLGYGLDEVAIRTVSKWKFKPATYQGKPVDLRANIEIAFRLNDKKID